MKRTLGIPPALWRVFVWLFWGDFVLVLMEQVVPSLVPIMLREYQLSNTAISLIMGSLPGVFGLLVAPLINYRSDQTRTRWGRRLPFVVLALPWIVLSLTLIPFSPELARCLNSMNWVAGLLHKLNLSALTVAFTVTITGYTIFGGIASGVYSFLVADIVPGQFMGRFMSLFRIFTLAGLFVFSYFIMGLAESHLRAVFFGTALLYGAGFTLVCLKVKEPPYPPPTDTGTANPLHILRSYATECFRHPLYGWFYAAFALYAVSQLAGNLFDVLFMKETLGMSLSTLGKVRAWTAIAVVPLAYLCGHLVDRWKSQRAIVLCALVLALAKLAGYCFIRSPTSYIWWTILYNVTAFFWGVTYAAYIPNMLPKDRYGQFASCNGMVTGLVLLTVNPLCGLFFDWVKDYRYVYLWPAILMAVTALMFWQVNRHWRRCGGPDHYTPP